MWREDRRTESMPPVFLRPDAAFRGRVEQKGFPSGECLGGQGGFIDRLGWREGAGLLPVGGHRRTQRGSSRWYLADHRSNQAGTSVLGLASGEEGHHLDAGGRSF